MKWKVSFSGVVCENTCYYRTSAAEKRIKKQNAKSGVKGNKYLGQEARSALKFHRVEDDTNHETLNACLDIISCHILYACSNF